MKWKCKMHVSNFNWNNQHSSGTAKAVFVTVTYKCIALPKLLDVETETIVFWQAQKRMSSEQFCHWIGPGSFCGVHNGRGCDKGHSWMPVEHEGHVSASPWCKSNSQLQKGTRENRAGPHNTLSRNRSSYSTVLGSEVNVDTVSKVYIYIYIIFSQRPVAGKEKHLLFYRQKPDVQRTLLFCATALRIVNIWKYMEHKWKYMEIYGT